MHWLEGMAQVGSWHGLRLFLTPLRIIHSALSFRNDWQRWGWGYVIYVNSGDHRHLHEQKEEQTSLSVSQLISQAVTGKHWSEITKLERVANIKAMSPNTLITVPACVCMCVWVCGCTTARPIWPDRMTVTHLSSSHISLPLPPATIHQVSAAHFSTRFGVAYTEICCPHFSLQDGKHILFIFWICSRDLLSCFGSHTACLESRSVRCF